MRFALFGKKEEFNELVKIFQSILDMDSTEVTFSSWDNYDEFIHDYPDTPYDALFVMADGGEGLEALNAGITINNRIPRVWFASDKKLGPQAVRMGTSFFAPKPINKEVVEQALKRCGIRGNYYSSTS